MPIFRIFVKFFPLSLFHFSFHYILRISENVRPYVYWRAWSVLSVELHKRGHITYTHNCLKSSCIRVHACTRWSVYAPAAFSSVRFSLKHTSNPRAYMTTTCVCVCIPSRDAVRINMLILITRSSNRRLKLPMTIYIVFLCWRIV